MLTICNVLEAQNTDHTKELIEQCNKIGGFINEAQAKELRNITDQNDWFHGKLRASEIQNKTATQAIDILEKDIDSLIVFTHKQTNIIELQDERFKSLQELHKLEIEDKNNEIKFVKKTNFNKGLRTGIVVSAFTALLGVIIFN